MNVNHDSAERLRGHPFFATCYGWLSPALEAGRIGTARRELLAQATGVVIDLGAGTGTNLPHLPTTVTQVHAVEPDPHMIRRMPPQPSSHVTVHQAGGERLPLPDDSVDTVLATLTLCTVHDVPAVLAEIRRVLRPDGRVLVLEHVLASDRRTARWQTLLRVPWRLAGAGCHPNRDTVRSLAQAGFDTSGLSRFRMRGALLASEWITGAVS